MRNFTNSSIFDDTLPVSDGRMEIGSAVPIDELRGAMEDWFRRKGYLPKDSPITAYARLRTAENLLRLGGWFAATDLPPQDV